MSRRALRVGAVAGALSALGLLGVETLLAVRGAREVFVDPPSDPQRLGMAGDPLRLVVLGDSTAAGSGVPYELGIAVAAARHLATNRRVTFVNLARSGARLADVARSQAPLAARLRPDIVLLAAGANDVTHLTHLTTITRELDSALQVLRKANPSVRLIVTGAPDLGAVPRLAQPLRAVAGLRTRRVNVRVGSWAARSGAILAPVAARTGPLLRDRPWLFCADRFHPTAAGYALWIPVLTEALDRALKPERDLAQGAQRKRSGNPLP
jgi:lysophospholipase L1-like esterase